MYKIYFPSNIHHPYEQRYYKYLWQAIDNAEYLREISYIPMQIIDMDTNKVVWEHWLWLESKYI